MNSKFEKGLPSGDTHPYELSSEERHMLPEHVRTYIKALEQENQRLTREAMHDSLTGLYNRRAFYEQLEYTWSLRKRAEEDTGVLHRLSLICLDMDNLKEINDHYGHGIGDDALRRVAAAMKGRARESDILARIGGDEFAMALPGSDIDGAESVAKDILDAGCQPLTLQRKDRIEEISIGLSIGIATHNTADTPGGVLARADEALLQAKSDGKHRIVCFPE